VKFLVDAHLPRRLAYRLRERGHDALHTLDLPTGNGTTDAEINARSLLDERAVLTKDSDFVDSLILRGVPWKLVLITTGNIGNPTLLQLVDERLEVLVHALGMHRYVEFSRTGVIVHD
jgi:predicted nuclease of predicted toxin-antitoxin system